MWILEIEDVKSNITEWTFDNYCEADDFLGSYLHQQGIVEHNIQNTYATIDTPGSHVVGSLMGESGELFFNSGPFCGNFRLNRRVDQ